MSVVAFDPPAKFVVRIIKRLATNPSNRWANSYELAATEAGSETDLLAAGLALVAFEKALHQNAVEFVELLISTWEADSVPYDPAVFTSQPLSGTGGVGVVSSLEPLDKALAVARVVSTGRSGHIFYRGVLQEGDVEAPAGFSVLTDASGWIETVNDAIDAASLDQWLGPSATMPLHVVMINKLGTQVRTVQTFRVQGVTSLPTDHAWFNRT